MIPYLIMFAIPIFLYFYVWLFFKIQDNKYRTYHLLIMNYFNEIENKTIYTSMQKAYSNYLMVQKQKPPKYVKLIIKDRKRNLQGEYHNGKYTETELI